MTLPLPDPHIPDSSARRNFDRLAQQFPLECSTTNFREVPQARVYHNAAQAITTGMLTPLAFNSERYDRGTPSNNMHDTAVNNTRLVARVPGLYRVTAHVEWAAHATGKRELHLKLNGATYIGSIGYPTEPTGVTYMTVSTEWPLTTVGDYVEVEAYQDSGGNLNVNSAASYSPEFLMTWISPR